MGQDLQHETASGVSGYCQLLPGSDRAQVCGRDGPAPEVSPRRGQGVPNDAGVRISKCRLICDIGSHFVSCGVSYTPAQTLWHPFRQEQHAQLKCRRKFRSLFGSIPVVMYTDHANIVRLQDKPLPSVVSHVFGAHFGWQRDSQSLWEEHEAC